MFYSIIFIISFIIFRYFIKNYANKIGDEKLRFLIIVLQ